MKSTANTNNKHKAYLIFFIGSLLVSFLNSNSFAMVPERTGWWKFDNTANILAPETGYSGTLTLNGTHSTTAGPGNGNGAILIGSGSYYTLNHGIAANGGGSKVNEYTLQFDFSVPSIDMWHCFMQTDMSNQSDGDYFINPSGHPGVAAVGYSNYVFEAGKWYRLVIAVNNDDFFRVYLDGDLVTEGNVQESDGRFALASSLLLFADEDGEDGPIKCAEFGIWNKALSSAEIKELGGFNHFDDVFIMTREPYLQAPGTTSMTICWHDTATNNTHVEYGTTAQLGLTANGSYQLISPPYRWHSVVVNNLTPSTRYYYKVMSGDGESTMHTFTTLPEPGSAKKLRFIILGDTHASDTTMAGIILRAARAKAVQLYGNDIDQQITGILHSGDVVVSGSTPEHYTKQFFKPLSVLSGEIPTFVVAGNHEGENQMFYDYLKLESISAFPEIPALREKVWFQQIGNAVFIGLNTNITDSYGSTMASWLYNKLTAIEQDPGIDFVYLFHHHPPFSELWKAVLTFDGGPAYLTNTIFPILKQFSKVKELHYGHTHGFEIGTITSDTDKGDFRIICGGGSGGPLDPWAEGENIEFSDIHKTVSNYFFQILEIDAENHSYSCTAYSLGTLSNQHPPSVMDFWYHAKNQAAPAKPQINSISFENHKMRFQTSELSSQDSLMSVRLIIADSLSSSVPVILDTTFHWQNIYNVDNQGNPVDLNASIDLNNLLLPIPVLSQNKTYRAYVRYRDHNLKWSAWSDAFGFTPDGIDEKTGKSQGYNLKQNKPNPFSKSTTIEYQVPEACDVTIKVFDISMKLLSEKQLAIPQAGTYQFNYSNHNRGNNTLIYQMITSKYTETRTMIQE